MEETKTHCLSLIEASRNVLSALKSDGYPQFTEREEIAFLELARIIARLDGKPEPKHEEYSTLYKHPDDETSS